MSDQTASIDSDLDPDRDGGLKRSITGRLLFFYVLGDVLGSGIYVLIGDVAGGVGVAFWIAFAVGVSVATVTGMADAELVTKYPQAAGAALHVNKAFRNRTLTFPVTVTFLASSLAAAGALATDETYRATKALLSSAWSATCCCWATWSSTTRRR